MQVCEGVEGGGHVLLLLVDRRVDLSVPCFISEQKDLRVKWDFYFFTFLLKMHNLLPGKIMEPSNSRFLVLE